MMRIQQTLTFTAVLLLGSLTAPLTMAQDGVSAEVQALIVEAQADGAGISDAEAAQIAQAMAGENATPAQIATALNSNGASSVQVAAGLAAVGQTQNQIANTLVTSNVTTQAEAQSVAQQGQTAAVASGAAVVTSRAQASTAAAAGTLAVNGSGLVTDSSGKAVVVKTAGDQLLLVKAIIQGNKDNGGTPSPESNQNLANALNSALTDLGAGSSVNFDAGGSVDDLLAAADEAIKVAEENTGTDLDGDGGVGASPSTVS